MSHFCLMVIGSKSAKKTNEINEDITNQLEKYDENLVVKSVKSKEKHIQEKRDEIEKIRKNTYQKYLDNPEEYIKNSSNPRHVEYITNEFPKMLNWSDEECYQDAIKYYDNEQINEDGSTNETYNQHSKYDWYTIGGRWNGSLLLKSGNYVDQALLKDIDWDGMKEVSKKQLEKNWESYQHLLSLAKTDSEKENARKLFDVIETTTKEEYINANVKNFITYAVVKDGEWYEKGEMGWWGISSNEVDNWEETFNHLLSDVDGDRVITIIDCHI